MTTLSPLLVRCFEIAGYDTSKLTASRHIVSYSPTGEQFFTKTGRDVRQMRGEVESLRAMAKNCPSVVPKVFGFEVAHDGNEAGTVSQFFDLSSFRRSETQQELGRRVAALHHSEKGVKKYGFAVPTHCGLTEQDNAWEEEWGVFFRDRRLADLVRRIDDGEITTLWEQLRDR